MPFFFDENAPQPSGWHGLAQRPQSDWADEMFRALQENELRLLCLDFDRTILRVHTSGCTAGPPEALEQQVRRLQCQEAAVTWAAVERAVAPRSTCRTPRASACTVTRPLARHAQKSCCRSV